MRLRSSSLLLAVLALPAPVSPAGTGVDLVATFTDLENAFADGYKKKDARFLEDLLAPEYVLVVSGRPGQPVDRSAWLGLLPQYDVQQFAISDVVVRCLSPAPGATDTCDIAAVSSINRQKATVGGQDRSGEFFIVDIWARRGGRWRVTSRYSGRTEGSLPTLMKPSAGPRG